MWFRQTIHIPQIYTQLGTVQIERGLVMLLAQKVSDVRENEMMEVIDRARMVSNVMKALSHESRLIILCHLVAGPKSVTELQSLLLCRQSSVSQQLTRLRLDKLVVSRRVGKSMYYSLAEGDTADLIGVLHKIFCGAKV